MKSIDLSFISKYRSSFMGFAIFWIFFYHTGIDIPGLRELFALGWMGVDIFFFVSGFGLCASLTKNSSTKRYFIRRFSRIIPTWQIILALMAILGILVGLKGFPSTSADYFYWFTGLGWWTGNCNFEWYIPTLIVFYIFAPLLSKLSVKKLAIVTVLSAMTAILFRGGILHVLNHVYMSYSRIPIYVSGFLVYKLWRQNKPISFKLWLPIAIVGCIGFLAGMYVKCTDIPFGLTIARVCIPIFIVPMLYVFGKIIGYVKPLEFVLSFLGLISLEIYLLHINHEFSHYINVTLLVGVNDWLVKMVWFAMVVVTAWILHKCVQLITSPQSTEPHDTVKE